MQAKHGEVAARRILGTLALAKKYGIASTDDACALALETSIREYHFVRRYLEHKPQLPLGLRQVVLSFELLTSRGCERDAAVLLVTLTELSLDLRYLETRSDQV